MNKIIFVCLFLLFCSNVVRAQVPATVNAHWNPNPATDNVTQYTIILDSAAPVVVPITACTATDCVQALTVPTFGLHSVNLTAQNMGFSGLQSSLPATATFTLAAAPVVATGLRVTK
jgi:hypothetical protein